MSQRVKDAYLAAQRKVVIFDNSHQVSAMYDHLPKCKSDVIAFFSKKAAGQKLLQEFFDQGYAFEDDTVRICRKKAFVIKTPDMTLVKDDSCKYHSDRSRVFCTWIAQALGVGDDVVKFMPMPYSVDEDEEG